MLLIAAGELVAGQIRVVAAEEGRTKVVNFGMLLHKRTKFGKYYVQWRY